MVIVKTQGDSRLEYSDEELQEMVDDPEMYRQADNLPKWLYINAYTDINGREAPEVYGLPPKPGSDKKRWEAIFNLIESLIGKDAFIDVDSSSPMEWKMRYEKNSKSSHNSTTIMIKEDVRVPGTDIILEAGDKIEVLKESSFSEIFVQSKEGTLIDYESVFDVSVSGPLMIVNVGTRPNDLKTLSFNLDKISSSWGSPNESNFSFLSEHGLSVKLG